MGLAFGFTPPRRLTGADRGAFGLSLSYLKISQVQRRRWRPFQWRRTGERLAETGPQR